MMLENKQLDEQDNDPNKEHKNRYPVDAMHIPHPLGIRRIRIPLLYKQVLPDLSPHSHSKN
jgi:hypothetical protein